MTGETNWYGIDFGTTNSALTSITEIEGVTSNTIHYGENGYPIPSIVAIKKDNSEILIGMEVKERLADLGEDYEYFPSIKSVIKENKTYTINGQDYTPVDIAAELFKGLKRNVEKKQNTMSSAVVAVPVGFKSEEKEKLREAAELANFNIEMFISEPTAAFCSNYSALKQYKNIAVFDWGGGTLDVAIINVQDGRIHELSTEGMKLAGNDIDKKMAEYFHLKFIAQKNSNLRYEDLTNNIKLQLLNKCEFAKCEFSDDEEEVFVRFNNYANLGPVNAKMRYFEFKELVSNTVEKAIECLEVAVEKANLNLTTLDCILCVGGSSKLRPFRERLEQKYNGTLAIKYPREAMWDIAEGAAMTATKPGKYAVSKPIGLLLSDNNFYPLIKEGQRIPCSESSLILAMTEDNQNNQNSARFIFTDSGSKVDRTFIEYKSIPVRAFDDERIKISWYIDPNFIFKIKISTNKKYNEDVWVYDKVKVYYEISE